MQRRSVHGGDDEGEGEGEGDDEGEGIPEPAEDVPVRFAQAER